MRRWLREPLLHFLLLGAALFALHRLVAPPPGDSDAILIAAPFVDALREDHRQRTGRPPTPQEEQGLVARFVDEEILYREARALGLDRGDVIVRRRLAQKMESLLGAEALVEPSDADLAAFAAAHPGELAAPPRRSLEQVFFDRGRRGATVENAAREALAALQRGGAAHELGDPFLRGRSFVERPRQELVQIFGPELVATVEAAPADTWVGPLASPYGLHLVRIRGPAQAVIADGVRREEVREAWLAARRPAEREESLARLRERYRITIAGPPPRVKP